MMAGQNPNMDQFDAYFRRADLDHDGRISGAEAVSFFQGSNLSKQVLAQIWMHADQNRTGFLGRPEFYNALKLVTVAQSKRELTPDMVKAALYGPASAKIPAPQINLAAVPAPQPTSMTPSLAPQTGTVPPMVSQNLGFRGQVPPNAGMNQQYFPSSGNQSMRAPLPLPTATGSHPPQGLASPDFPRGGSMVGPGPANSNISSDWLGSRTVGTPSAATSQAPNRGISPSAISQAPNRGISTSLPSAAPKPQDPLSASSLMTPKDPKASFGAGNGFASDPMFGGDVFSANQSLSKPASPTPTFSASSAPASSAIVPVTTGPQPSAKLDPLDMLNAFTRQPTGGQVQASPSVPKPNQQVPAQYTSSLGPLAKSAEAGTPASNQSQPQWPKMTRAGVQRYTKVFLEVDTDRDGKITGEQARNLFLSWRLPREVLKQVWDLSDQDNDSMLSLREFCIALYLMERYREGHTLPPALPSSILLDETLLSLAGPPNPAYGGAAWGSALGMRPQQGMPGPQQMAPPGLRPPQGTFAGPDGQMHFNQQQTSVPSMENSHVNQLGNGEQNSFDSKPQEAAETEKKVEDKEKMILDSKEKVEFYRTKMQDLVLYKSRCDNRLNEITERALGDKREAEMLGKKYEEKYKQVAEIASKLTIEEASFRDIQERKMELNQAIVKMEQGGSADGILQVRADRIQSDLEELLRALTERCKKHGVHVKSAAVIELPQGWQPGVPEVSAVWDEDWDKFEDEGFSFDVAVPDNAKSTSPQHENSSPINSFSPDLVSNADGKLEKPFSKVEHVFESESAYSHSEDESAKSPVGSPARQTAFDSPFREDSDNHFRKSFEADTETQRSFDESAWGTFDNNDDTDSVWGFNNSNAKDLDHEKNGESYFFGSSDFGASPRQTDSPSADSMFHKKSAFGFDDSVSGSPNSRAGNSPRFSGGAGDSFFDNMSSYDSFSTTQDRSFSRFDSISSNAGQNSYSTQERNFSRFDSMSSNAGQNSFSTQDRGFSRFDSINSSAGFDHSRGFSFDDSDPFGSSGPFKVSSESQTPKKDSDKWNAF